MTYCAGILVDAGLVMASDSRTNAGVDNVSTFCKMKVFEAQADRWIGIVCSGHLGITQEVFARMEQDAALATGPNWRSASNMREVAAMIGELLNQVREDQSRLLNFGVDTSANFIVGGQIGSEAPCLFMVYAQGNFIQAQEGTTFFQIGEAKYGKPMLDRVVQKGMSLEDAAKCALVSFDATLRSNLSVGAPIDLAAYSSWSLGGAKRWRFEEGDAYFEGLRSQWGQGLRSAFAGLPAPPC